MWRETKKQNEKKKKAQKWLKWMMCGSRSGGFKCYKVTGHALSLCPKARVHPLWVPWRAQASFMGNVPDRADYSPFFILSAQPRKPSLAIPFRPLSLLSCLSSWQRCHQHAWIWNVEIWRRENLENDLSINVVFQSQKPLINVKEHRLLNFNVGSNILQSFKYTCICAFTKNKWSHAIQPNV